MNKVLLVGNIARVNPPVQGPTNIRCNFTIAVNNPKRGDKASTSFIPCVAWNETANFIGNHITVGTMVSIVGRIDQRSYLSTKTNQQVSAINVVVENINILRKKNEENNVEATKSSTISMNELFPEPGIATNMENSDQKMQVPSFDNSEEHDWLDEIENNEKEKA